jgi:hypothetical protein
MGSKWLTRKGEAQTISEADLAAKIDIWVNVENHHRGDCTSCPDPNHSGHASAHRADKLAIAVLPWVLAGRVDLIRKCNPRLGSTHGDESFHSIKEKYCNKRQNF